MSSGFWTGRLRAETSFVLLNLFFLEAPFPPTQGRNILPRSDFSFLAEIEDC